MIIKNFNQLATTPLRRQALEIIEAGYAAIQTDQVIKKTVSLDRYTLKIQDREFNLKRFDKVYVIAFGKSSYAAAQTLEEILGDRLAGGCAIGITDGPRLQHINYKKGTHPSPSPTNFNQTKKIIGILEKARAQDLILAVISGGGSALLAAPYQIDVETQASITEAVMDAGADIHELNIVRKHLSRVKGRLAQLAYPAKLVTLIFSDVPGNDLSTIASGPTVIDSTTNDQAQEVLEKYDIFEQLGLDEIELSETPKKDVYFKNVENFLILDPAGAVQAMEEKAVEIGFKPQVLSTTLEGNAHEVGRQLLREAQPGEALMAAGETTVEVKGDGIGGRNQELVLANLGAIRANQVLISAASDGADHSDCAGAVGDRSSFIRAQQSALNIDKYLTNNDSFHFFEQTGDGLITGTLDSNVADMFLVLTAK